MNRTHPILGRGSRTRKSKYSRDQWVLLECLETKLVYLDNPVGYSELEKEYAWEKTYNQEKLDRQQREPFFAGLSNLYRKIRIKIRKDPKVKRLPVELILSHFSSESSVNLLDIGCGNGNYGVNIADRVAKYSSTPRVIPQGVEISTELHRLANDRFQTLGGKVIHGPALDGVLQLDADSQHLILMHSFLEHEVNPLELLAQCRKVMVNGGFLIIKVPNYSCWNRKIRQKMWCGFRFPDHVNYFSPKNLKDICRRADLKVFRMDIFDRFPTSDNMWLIAQKIEPVV